MTEEKRKDFESVISLIQDKKYDEAINILRVYQSNDEENQAYANYLMGYINTRWDYKNRKEESARRYLYLNISSDYPHPYAYVIYANVAEDKNIAENYLEIGANRFPNDPRIYNELLRVSNDKQKIIQRIDDNNFTDGDLLGAAISYLVANQTWDKVLDFARKLENGNQLGEYQKRYLRLVSAYAYLFKKDLDFEKAKEAFKSLILEDTDNYLNYSHYIGVIYTYIKLKDYQNAIDIFDRLPVNNSICDFDEMPWPFGISLNFETLYKEIFQTIFTLFEKDKHRKNKAMVLYSLYRYHPSMIFDVCRYSKTDANILSRYLKSDFNADVASAVYNMRCHFEQFEEANEALWLLLINGKDPKEYYLHYSDIIDNIDSIELTNIVEKTLIHLQNDDFDEEVFITFIFAELIAALHKNKKYEEIRLIADCFNETQLIETPCAFECAYAYGTVENERATTIYEGIVKKAPKNSSAINNLGVRYEHKQELFKALDCYAMALSISVDDEIHRNNLQRINQLIQQQTQREISAIKAKLTVKNLNSIGYTIQLCQKVMSITDEDLRNIIFRDLKECAIAVVAGQDKTATIMCGSIIEALLVHKIDERSIVKYDISEISKSKRASNYPIKEMALNELLFVAEKENIIAKNSYHLGHYIRDYRNVVHPAKEVRMREEVSHSNVETMWAVLKRLIEELL